MQMSFLSGPLTDIAALVPVARVRPEQLRARAYAAIYILSLRRPLGSLLKSAGQLNRRARRIEALESVTRDWLVLLAEGATMIGDRGATPVISG
jgi:hypothetical protein